MELGFYKQRKHHAVSGVLAGLSDKFGWDLSLVRVLFVLSLFLTNIPGVLIYIVLAVFLPYKEDLLEEKFGTGPRKRKEAKATDDKEDWIW